MAKNTSRPDPNQAPPRLFDLLKDYIAQITPPTIKTELIQLDNGAPAILLERESRAMQAAIAACEKVWENEVLFERVGGSVPITYYIQKVAKEMTIMGFNHRAAGAHGPNEHIYIDMFHKGIETAIHFYQECAKQ